MDVDTWVSLAVLASMFAGLYAALRRDMGSLRTELKGDIAKVDERVSTLDDKVSALDGRVIRLAERVVTLDGRMLRLEDRMTRMDDRIFTLAVALKPLIEDAQRLTPKLIL